MTSNGRLPVARVVVALLALALAACGGGPGEPAASALRVDPGSVTLDIGATARFVATPVDQKGSAVVNTNPVIQWRTLAPGIATVDQGGVVTAVTTGTATIEASSGSLTGTAQVTVNRPPVGQVVITPGALSLFRGESGQLSARVSTVGGAVVTDRTVTWTSLDESLASVIPTGSGAGATVVAKAPGTAVIRATSEGISAQVNVLVGPDPVIALSSDSATITLARTSASPEDRTVQISNGGGGTLSGLSVAVAYLDNGVSGWLATALSSSTQPSTLTLRASAGSLGEGSYRATVTVASSQAGVASRAIAVRLVIGAGPSIAFAVDTVRFTTFAGGAAPPAQGVTVSNGGGATLSGLSIGSVQWNGTTWGTVALSSATAPASLSVTPTAAASSLAAGRYVAVIPVSSSVPGTTPRSVAAILTVDPPPVISVNATSVSLVAAIGKLPVQQKVLIDNSDGRLQGLALGGATYLSGAGGWLVASLSGGASAAPEVSVTANTAGLAIGTYTARLPVVSSNPFVAPVQLAITLNIGAAEVIQLSAPSVAITYTEGTAAPTPRVVTVSNGGTGTLSGLTLSPIAYSGGGSGWLGAALASSNAPTNLTLSISPAALAAGTHTATLQVRSSLTGVIPATVTVTLTVRSGAVIALSSGDLSFAGLLGGSAPAVQNVTVTNAGTGVLSGLSLGNVTYTSGASAGWLSASLAQTSAPATITVSVAVAGLAVGTYTAELPVETSLAGVAPQTLSVSLVVSPATTMALSASNVTLNAPNGGGNPTAAQVTVSNSGSNPLVGLSASITYLTNAPTPWLTATLSSTTAPATLTLSANVAGLASGNYSASVAVASPVATNAPRIVNVTLTIPFPIVTLSASSSSASVNQSVGTVLDNFSPSVITITNAGGGTLAGLGRTITYNQGTGWLSAIVSTASVPATVTLAVNSAVAASLARGTYTATVSVNAPGSPPALITVTLRSLLTYNTHVASLWTAAPVVAAQQCAASGCHDAVTRARGLDLTGTNATVYSRLLTQTGAGGLRLVLPGSPGSSLMYTRTASTTSPMPTGGRVTSIYTTIQDWINDGARQ